jgi:hypothetical protein
MNMNYSQHLSKWALGFALLPVACGGVAESGDDELEIVEEGKADNYYSSVAAEFKVTGALPVALTAEEFADEKLRTDKAIRRVTAFGLYLTTYVTAKFEGIDKNGDGVISEDERFFHNMGYGGFQAMVRNQTAQTLSITADAQGGGYTATFSLDLAGPRNLLTKIPGERLTSAGGGLRFDVRMPKGATMSPTDVPRTDIRRFNPETHVGELETVRVTANANPTVGNAYPPYAAFLADGVFDITLFFGHDYNKDRSDLREAREAFATLKELGFAAPAANFDALTSESGPFTRTLRANGKSVRAEVRIFHSNMFETARQKQHDLALAEITARDVFFYNGHAGPYFGFYMDEARAATVNYGEFATAPFKADKQQLVIAQGCQTYSQYADMLYASPAKDEANLDVITTVNYSYGEGTLGILRNLLGVTSSGALRPADYYRIVEDLNSEWLNNYKEVFYGVMGIDGNPRIHPFANIEALGKECRRVSDCGDSSGNVCVKATSRGKKACGVVSLAAAACPSGTTFRQVASGTMIKAGACLRTAP